MEKLLPALTKHIEVSYSLRINVPPVAAETDITLRYPEFIDKVLVPCLGQLSVHLAYSNPALWDMLTQTTMAHSRHGSAIVRFAALTSLHMYIKRNNEDFLLLLPKMVGYISELMQDTNILVEKLAQDVIKTIERLSGETLSDYLK
jgi:U3 small nucleolar RNA-associated protein 10